MEAIDQLIAGLNHWQICGVVIWLLIQGTVLALVPEEILILSIGVLSARGQIHPIEGFLAIEIGLMTANSGMVFVASRFGNHRFFQKDVIRRALEAFRRRGSWVIFAIRFVPFTRGPVYAAAGLSKMRVRDFFKIDFSASLIQVSMLMGLGAYIGSKSGSITEAYKTIGLGMLGVGILILAFFGLREKFLVKPAIRDGSSDPSVVDAIPQAPDSRD